MTRPAFDESAPAGTPPRRRALLRLMTGLAPWHRRGLACTGLWSGLVQAREGAPALLLARTLGEHEPLDVAQYLVSEKLDGVRAWWDGHRLRHRSGGEIAAPPAWLERLPAGCSLDGELWLGRERFDDLSALLRRHDGPGLALWSQVRYRVFEQPNGSGDFAQRLAMIQSWHRLAGPDSPWDPLPQEVLPNRRVLDEKLRQVVAQGGEGLMLHRSDAPYVTGRSEVLLKYKPLDDAEAVVIGYLPGRGRHIGRVGALRVRTPEGREFALGSGLSDARRERPPAPGTVVIYRFRGQTSTGLPRFATFWRERSD